MRQFRFYISECTHKTIDIEAEDLEQADSLIDSHLSSSAEIVGIDEVLKDGTLVDAELEEGENEPYEELFDDVELNATIEDREVSLGNGDYSFLVPKEGE